MSDYFFNKGAFIIIQNFLKGITLSLPLLFDGLTKPLMYLILFVLIGKGLYDVCKKNNIEVPLLILLCVPLSGIYTGLCISFIGIVLYFNLLVELSSCLFNLILTNLIVLAGGIYLAFRLGVYKHKSNHN